MPKDFHSLLLVTYVVSGAALMPAPFRCPCFGLQLVHLGGSQKTLVMVGLRKIIKERDNQSGLQWRSHLANSPVPRQDAILLSLPAFTCPVQPYKQLLAAYSSVFPNYHFLCCTVPRRLSWMFVLNLYPFYCVCQGHKEIYFSLSFHSNILHIWKFLTVFFFFFQINQSHLYQAIVEYHAKWS